MAKDKRLYMTFPNDFWMHPKIAPLTVEAKWAFVEMNGYSRMQDLDGRIPAVMMHRMWASDVVVELCASHADRPLMFHDEAADEYVIRDYAAHQQTTADREEMSAKRSVSGKLGANKRWNGKPMASAMANEWQTDGKGMAETETETETEKIKRVSATRGTRLPADWMPSEALTEWAQGERADLDVGRQVAAFKDYWPAQAGARGVKVSWDLTFRSWIRNARSGPPSRPAKDVRALTLIEQGRAMDEAVLRRELTA